MSNGDYLRNHIKYQGCSTEINFVATDGNLTLITGKANKTIRVQRIIVTIKTSAAQAITFEDNAGGTPIYVAKIAASPSVDSRYDFDFGPLGKPLTTGLNLMMDMTAGNAGHVEVLAYYRPDPLMTVGNNN